MLQLLSKIAAERTDLEQQAIYHEIKLREDQMSTAMGRGIAIPHARVEGLEQSYIFVAQNRHGLEWDSPDGRMVRLLILILSPKESPNAQIQILQCLANVLHNRDSAQALVSSNDPSFIWASLRNELNASRHCNID
ncbi:MAG: PTS sugar transporter subunit IIA [Candidatus Cloacimonetes bacterium]|nr:PTS sugar transporter subunit IIA [Candidatus Cloacimonadota bacterium]